MPLLWDKSGTVRHDICGETWFGKAQLATCRLIAVGVRNIAGLEGNFGGMWVYPAFNFGGQREILLSLSKEKAIHLFPEGDGKRHDLLGQSFLHHTVVTTGRLSRPQIVWYVFTN